METDDGLQHQRELTLLTIWSDGPGKNRPGLRPDLHVFPFAPLTSHRHSLLLILIRAPALPSLQFHFLVCHKTSGLHQSVHVLSLVLVSHPSAFNPPFSSLLLRHFHPSPSPLSAFEWSRHRSGCFSRCVPFPFPIRCHLTGLIIPVFPPSSHRLPSSSASPRADLVGSLWCFSRNAVGRSTSPGAFAFCSPFHALSSHSSSRSSTHLPILPPTCHRPPSRFSSVSRWFGLHGASVLFVLHPMVRAHLSLHLSSIVTLSHHCSDTFIFSISHRLLCPARTAFVGTVSVFVMQLVFVSAATG